MAAISAKSCFRGPAGAPAADGQCSARSARDESMPGSTGSWGLRPRCMVLPSRAAQLAEINQAAERLSRLSLRHHYPLPLQAVRWLARCPCWAVSRLPYQRRVRGVACPPPAVTRCTAVAWNASCTAEIFEARCPENNRLLKVRPSALRPFGPFPWVLQVGGVSIALLGPRPGALAEAAQGVCATAR